VARNQAIRSEQELIDLTHRFGLLLQDVFCDVEIRLFGSYLHKKAHPFSDVDLAIISRDFAGMEPFTAMKILNRMKLKIDTIIEPSSFTPEEMSSPEIGTLAFDVAQNYRLMFKAEY
jgi:predicted nucleotidyltransferase